MAQAIEQEQPSSGQLFHLDREVADQEIPHLLDFFSKAFQLRFNH